MNRPYVICHMDARMEHYTLEDVQYRNDTLWLKYKRK